MTGVYVHIPFCGTRCVYCDFVSSTLGEEWQDGYLSALEDEMARRREENGTPHASTIYIGGGTPSRLTPKALRRLVGIISNNFAFDTGTEFTIELNPDDVSAELTDTLADLPAINRLSMGVQSLDDGLLRFLRRRHTAGQAVHAMETLREAGHTNLSVDLIYGIPGQTPDMFRSDVETMMSLRIPHLSAYALQFEPGTPLWRMKERGETEEVDEEVARQCYMTLMDTTAAAGMEHYELSNFALPGFRSRHNSSYWQGVPYLGFGAGAHSYDGRRTRTANTPSVAGYMAGKGTVEREVLTDGELYDERVMLSLRTSEGLSLARLGADFGKSMLRYCLNMAQPHITNGTLENTGSTLRLTRKGMFVSNGIMADLMSPTLPPNPSSSGK